MHSNSGTAPIPGRPWSWNADKYRTIYIDYQGRHSVRTIEAEFYYGLYAEGFGHVNLCCPLCQTGVDSVDVHVEAQGDPLSRTLTIRREKKHFEVDSDGRLTVRDPITCTYCGVWHVRITNGVARDSI